MARERLPIFAGQDMPSTIVRKEIIDNCIDIVSENRRYEYISMNKYKSLHEVYKSSITSAPKESIKRSFKKDMEKIMADIMNEVDCYPLEERKWMKEAFCEFLQSKAKEASLLYGGKHDYD